MAYNMYIILDVPSTIVKILSILAFNAFLLLRQSLTFIVLIIKGASDRARTVKLIWSSMIKNSRHMV